MMWEWVERERVIVSQIHCTHNLDIYTRVEQLKCTHNLGYFMLSDKANHEDSP